MGSDQKQKCRRKRMRMFLLYFLYTFRQISPKSNAKFTLINNKNSTHAFHIQWNHVSGFASMKYKALTVEVISYLVIPCSRHGQVQEQEKGRGWLGVGGRGCVGFIQERRVLEASSFAIPTGLTSCASVWAGILLLKYVFTAVCF